MEPRGSLLYTQDPNTGSHPEPNEIHIRQRHFFDTILWHPPTYVKALYVLSFFEAPHQNSVFVRLCNEHYMPHPQG